MCKHAFFFVAYSPDSTRYVTDMSLSWYLRIQLIVLFWHHNDKLTNPWYWTIHIYIHAMRGTRSIFPRQSLNKAFFYFVMAIHTCMSVCGLWRIPSINGFWYGIVYCKYNPAICLIVNRDRRLSSSLVWRRSRLNSQFFLEKMAFQGKLQEAMIP